MKFIELPKEFEQWVRPFLPDNSDTEPLYSHVFSQNDIIPKLPEYVILERKATSLYRDTRVGIMIDVLEPDNYTDGPEQMAYVLIFADIDTDELSALLKLYNLPVLE